MTPALTESDLEQIVLGWFGELGYTILYGPEIAPETPQSERAFYSDPLLPARVQSALARLNPHLPHEALEDAFRKTPFVRTSIGGRIGASSFPSIVRQGANRSRLDEREPMRAS